MGTAQEMIARARKDIGLGEPNYLQKNFSERVGWAYYNYAWCQAAINEWAHETGNHSAVMFGVDDAYTVTAAERFQQHGRWIAGTKANTNAARPGDIVYFDWGYTDDIERIDHVGIVVKSLGNGYVQTIEGNAGDRCGVHERHYSIIAGFGRPDYSGSSVSIEEDPLIGLKIGDKGQAVKALQELCRAAGQGATIDKYGGSDGNYGPGTAEALRLVRKSVGSRAGKGYGNKVDGWAYAQLLVAVARVQGGK